METRQGLSKPTTVLLTAASAVVVIAGLREASEILSPLLMAGFLAIISTPPIVWLRSHGLPKWAAYSIVFALLGLLTLLSISGISDSIDQIRATLPFYEERLSNIMNALGGWLHGFGVLPSTDAIRDLVNPGRIMQLFGYLMNPAGDLIANLFLIILAVLFILTEAGSLRRKLFYLLSERRLSFHNLEGFTRTVNRYFLIKTLMSLVTGVFIATWLSVIGVDFAILWGWLAFFLNFVPYIGSVLAAVPAVLIALLGQGTDMAIYAAIGFVLANVVVGSVLEPRFLGQGLGLSTLVVFISMVFWGWVLGPVGMFLSAPLTTLVKIAAESDEKSRWLGVLLGTGSELRSKKAQR